MAGAGLLIVVVWEALETGPCKTSPSLRDEVANRSIFPASNDAERENEAKISGRVLQPAISFLSNVILPRLRPGFPKDEQGKLNDLFCTIGRQTRLPYARSQYYPYCFRQR